MTTQERKNFQARFDEALVALQTARGAALLLASAERCRGVQEEYERRASELDQIRAMLAETADDSAAEETRLLKSGETAAAVSALLSHNRERVLEIRLLRASEEAQITELRASVKALKLGHSDSIDALQKELELTKRQQRAVEIRCSALAVQNDERTKTLLAIRDVLRAGGAAGNLESDAGLIGAVREAVSSVGSKLAEYNRGVSEGTQALLGMLNGALEDGGSSVDALSRVRKLVAKAREQHEEILALQREVQGDRDQTRALRHQLSELGCASSLSLLQAVEGLGGRLRVAERARDEWKTLWEQSRDELVRVRRERDAATGGREAWIWSDTDLSDLATMSAEMTVKMRAEQLRDLLAVEPEARQAVDEWTNRLRVPGGWIYRWETPAYNGSPGGAAMAFVPEPDEAVGK